MKLLGHDEYSGITEYFGKDETGKCVIKSVQDVEPIVEANKKLLGQLDKKQEWWKIGTVPNVICLQWARESGTVVFSKEWQDYAIKQLNNPDYRAFNVNKIKL